MSFKDLLFCITLFAPMAAFCNELSPSSPAELRSVGFADDEIQAVAESSSISKWLSVKSFVDESNSGNLAIDDSVRRESHGKAHACLRVKMDVTGSGPGVFKRGASYPGWLRISNGGAYQRDDKATHISRGFALKLLGVDQTPKGTHDFLFITSPRFFIHDIRHYPDFLKSTGNGRFGFLMNLLFNLSWEEKMVVYHRLSLKISNLLESPEYSAVPYAYGDTAVKYALAPCSLPNPPVTPESHSSPSNSGPDYLADAMDQTLRASDPDSGVCYSFYVQRPRSEAQDPLENPTAPWGGSFERVATLTIPYGQHRGGAVDYRDNESECESMSFDPFNATPENQPLGKVNWTRKVVYAQLAHFRRTEFPRLYSHWLANHEDPAVPAIFRKELAQLKHPENRHPSEKDTAEPVIDAGFARLGIGR